VNGFLSRRSAAVLLIAAVLASCGRGANRAAASAPRPSILLVTLDTTRYDAIGPEASGVDTPAFDTLAARGRRYRQAYAAVPETLPSHTSIMSGLYPGGDGVHENARYVPGSLPLLAQRLHDAGYRTSAFVSSFILARRFGLARGFDVYDDALPDGKNERSSRATTDAALVDLQKPVSQPRFIWVHYYDAHFPYDPPAPYRTKYKANPYLGEIAAMDEQLGRLVQAFERVSGSASAIVVVADHGEGLGEHGEQQHGDLLYQATMHVPLALVGPGVAPGVSDDPVSTRRVFYTILDWAGVSADHSLRGSDREVVLGEAMKPFLEYGWQPQIMAVDGHYKAILSGRVETYDLSSDPREAHDLGSGAALPAGMRKALEDYPVPSPAAEHRANTLDPDAARRLASLGYVSAGAAPIVRKDAPRPADMTALLAVIEHAESLFGDHQYRDAIALFEHVLGADPNNVAALLSLASAYSALGQNDRAMAMFQRAAAMAPDSDDVKTYLGLHYVRTKDWDRAAPLLDHVIAAAPDRATAVEALATVKINQGEQAMDAGDTAGAIADFERARTLQPAAFTHDLELGVLYLAVHRFEDARGALDRALAADPHNPMALFKRAQVSVLLHEPDASARIRAARDHADATTGPLIQRERLFEGR
jgi:arylsulfatase A-like enzyme/Tfp pilus assembly protein PilF